MHGVSQVADADPGLSEEEFYAMIGAIRAGAVASFVMLIITAVQLVRGQFGTELQHDPIMGPLVIGEMLVYATCTVLIWHLSRFGTVLLFAFCFGKLGLFAMGFEYVGLLMGILLLFVIQRSSRNAFRLHALLRTARETQVDAIG